MKKSALYVSTVCLMAAVTFNACQKPADGPGGGGGGTPPKVYLKDTTVQYGANASWTGANVNLSMDLYFPDSTSKEDKKPIVFLLHKGGFIDGNKSEMKDYAEKFNAAGYTAAAVQYRLGWNEGTGNCDGDSTTLLAAGYRGLQDLHAAIRYMVEKAASYGMDKDRIFLAGISAGGVLAVNLPFLDPSQIDTYYPGLATVLGKLDEADNSIRTTFSVKAVANMWGGLVDSTILFQDNAVPVISFHGEADDAIPVGVGNYLDCAKLPELYGSQFIYDKLRSMNFPAVLHLMPGEGHDPPSYTAAVTVPDIICFFNQISAGNKPSGVFTGTATSCP